MGVREAAVLTAFPAELGAANPVRLSRGPDTTAAVVGRDGRRAPSPRRIDDRSYVQFVLCPKARPSLACASHPSRRLGPASDRGLSAGAAAARRAHGTCRAAPFGRRNEAASRGA